jgi:hypothetical protein
MLLPLINKQCYLLQKLINATISLFNFPKHPNSHTPHTHLFLTVNSKQDIRLLTENIM